MAPLFLLRDNAVSLLEQFVCPSLPSPSPLNQSMPVTETWIAWNVNEVNNFVFILNSGNFAVDFQVTTSLQIYGF